MKVYNQSELSPGDITGSVCTIGNFDGVHVGHQQIMRRLHDAKEKNGQPSIVYTFEPHPVRVLNPKKELRLIYNYDHKLRLLGRYNPDIVVINNFTHEMAATPAEDFVQDVLMDLFNVKHIVVGYDFNFGRGGDGNAAHLSAISKEKGYDYSVEQVAAVMMDGDIVSSSRIRRLIAAGEMRMVRRMLGRPFFLEGEVVRGLARGGSVLGVPTANLSTQQEIIPAVGVYAALVRVPDGLFHGAVSIGTNPTFEDNRLSVETHLIGYKGNLYGRPIEIHFVKRLRDQMRYDSITRLKEQILKDISDADDYLKTVSPEMIYR